MEERERKAIMKAHRQKFPVFTMKTLAEWCNDMCITITIHRQKPSHYYYKVLVWKEYVDIIEKYLYQHRPLGMVVDIEVVERVDPLIALS